MHWKVPPPTTHTHARTHTHSTALPGPVYIVCVHPWPTLPCSFSFAGQSYSSIVMCMQGYAAPGTSTECNWSETRSALTMPSSSSPRIALFWTGLSTDGELSLDTCTPSVAGQQSRMSWGSSGSGSVEVDALVRRASSIPGASTFTSTSYFVGTWENIHSSWENAYTCNRYTFQVVVAVSSSTSQAYVLMLYTRVPTTRVSESTYAGLRGASSALSVWASPTDGASSAASILGSGSNVGLAGLRVYRVDGSSIMQPGAASPPPPSPRKPRSFHP